ncbi:AI-2E family transporter [Sandarakinorhabdus sp. DWP1-3-1]|uniref:AI-2E family transporter n=1 Tax=Sandarakinorhabdus sp. DWP1-3-1 TaxID=2804627 RepID=UPI003CF2527E
MFDSGDAVPRRPPASPIDGGADTPAVTRLLHLATGVAAVATLYFGKTVLVPITLAILLAFVLAPVVNLLRRRHLPRPIAVAMTMALALGLIGGLGVIVVGQAATLADDAPRYARTIEAKVESVRDYAARRTASFTREFESKTRSTGARKAAQERSRAVTTPKTPGTAPVPVEVHQPEPSPFALAMAVITPILAPLEVFIIVMVITTFILFEREDLRDRFIRVFGSSDLHRTTLAMDDAGARLSRYFLAQLAVNTAFGTIIWAGLFVIGVPSAGLWGIVAGLLRFIPYIGPFLGAAPPLALAAAIDPGWTVVGHVALLFVIVEPIIGYVVEPLLYGRSTGLSPISVLVAALFWTWVWGPVGLVLSTPLTLCLVVLGRHVASLEFFDVLLGDRPPLTPLEMFYQRILGSDPEEALDLAEVLIEDQPLREFYDRTARATLLLAAADLRRGAMTVDKARHIADATLAMVHYFEDHDIAPPPTGSRPPASWGRDDAVICVAGRGAFDITVAAMAAQLLRRRGFGAVHVSGADPTALANDPRLPAAGIVCLVHLGLVGNPAHLRFLARRVTALAPGVPMIVGCWQNDEAVHAEALGAARNVDSLSAMVTACVTLANATNLAPTPAVRALPG